MVAEINKSDEQLVEEVREGNKELYIHIIERYQDKLYRYVVYLIRKKDDAEDVVQDTFIKAYINLNGFNINKKFSSWIYRIAHNEAMNKIGKYKKEVKMIDNYDIAGTQNIEEEYGNKEIRKMALSCLDEMPLMYSEPLALYYLDDKSYEEISDILHVPMGTVATRINRAKSLMKLICLKK